MAGFAVWQCLAPWWPAQMCRIGGSTDGHFMIFIPSSTNGRLSFPEKWPDMEFFCERTSSTMLSFFDRDSREGGKGRGTSVPSASQRYYQVPATRLLACTLRCTHAVTVHCICSDVAFFSRQPSFLSRIVAKIQNLAAWAMGNVSNL